MKSFVASGGSGGRQQRNDRLSTTIFAVFAIFIIIDYHIKLPATTFDSASEEEVRSSKLIHFSLRKRQKVNQHYLQPALLHGIERFGLEHIKIQKAKYQILENKNHLAAAAN